MRRFGLPILILFMLCGQLLRFPLDLLAFKTTAIVPSDMALAVALILVLARKLRLRRVFVRGSSLAWPIGVFVLVGIASLGVNADYYNLHSYEVFISSTYLGRWVLYCMAYFIVIDLIRSRQDVKDLAKALGTGLLIFAAFGICQAVYLPNFAFIVHPEAAAGFDWDIQNNRLVSTFLDPNLAGCLIAVGLAFAVCFLMEGYRTAWVPTGVLGCALLLTYSRGATLSFLAGLSYIIATGRYKRRGFIATGMLLVMAVLLAPYLLPHAQAYSKIGFSDPSAQERLASWAMAGDLIRSNPVFGVGFSTLPFVFPKYGYLVSGGASSFGLDGGLLTVFALTGILGLAAYCWILVKVLRMAHHVCGHSNDRLLRVLAKGSSAAVLIVVMSSFFTSSLLYVFIMGFYWIVFAMLNVAYNLAQQERKQAHARTVVAPAVDARRMFAGRAVVSVIGQR